MFYYETIVVLIANVQRDRNCCMARTRDAFTTD